MSGLDLTDVLTGLSDQALAAFVRLLSDEQIAGLARASMRRDVATAPKVKRAPNGTATSAVLALLAEGPQRMRDVSRRINISHQHATIVLRRLVDSGQAARVSRGIYRLGAS